MRNRIDLGLAPADLFLNPARQPGLSLVAEPEFVWRPRPPARITGFAASTHRQVDERIDSFLSVTRRNKTFRQVVEFATVPALLEPAAYRKSHVAAGGRFLPFGASGMRLMNRYVWANRAEDRDPEAELADHFDACQRANADAALSIAPALPPDTDFAIECRNTFNYFHFVTETLCHLTLLDDLPLTGRIFIHFPNHQEKTRDFARALIAALFPELVHRIVFARTPADHARVVTAVNLLGTYYLFPETRLGSVDSIAPSGPLWQGRRATRGSQAILAMNAVDQSLLRLRARALRAIEGRDVSHLPRRFFAGREPGQSRARPMAGEDRLVDLLQAFDFRRIAFESLSPLDQIALMAHAEIMVTAHGAGLANMLFANPDACVIELGTLQTAVHRWGDFWPHAHASGCSYVTFFADYNKPDPLTDPSFDTEGIVPVALSDRAVGQVAGFVASLLGHRLNLGRAADLEGLARTLLRAGAAPAAQDLLSANAALVSGNAGLLLLSADVHRALGNLASELLALTSAWAADRARWQTLVQILWCARAQGNEGVLSWALQTLREAFPLRFAEVVRDRAWLRDLV